MEKSSLLFGSFGPKGLAKTDSCDVLHLALVFISVSKWLFSFLVTQDKGLQKRKDK